MHRLLLVLIEVELQLGNAFVLIQKFNQFLYLFTFLDEFQ